MTRETLFDRTIFPAHILREAIQTLFPKYQLEKDIRHMSSIEIRKDTWTYDSLEQFLADYPKQTGYARTDISHEKLKFVMHFQCNNTRILVGAATHGPINEVFSVFERVADKCRIPSPQSPPKPKPPPPVIFIAHGRSEVWRDLKDHLADKHGYHVESYEVSARAGHTVQQVLADMIRRSSFACLVLTAEDEMADGTIRARQNVIHELGLCQGRLGWSRAIMLLEEGVEEFSNISGIQQIRFSKGKIKETFGEVLATLRRELVQAAK